ncbi:MAG: hypothetical protein WA634_08790 [Silvibacterium sp.]
MIEQQVGGMIEQLRRVRTLLGQWAVSVEGLADIRRRLAGSYRPVWKRVQKAGDAVDELRSQCPKLPGVHGQWRQPFRNIV